jgi:hypothetical protein
MFSFGMRKKLSTEFYFSLKSKVLRFIWQPCAQTCSLFDDEYVGFYSLSQKAVTVLKMVFVYRIIFLVVMVFLPIGGLEVYSVLEHLSSMCEALGLIPSIEKKNL